MSHPFQKGVGGRDESLNLVFLPAYQSMLTSSMTCLDVAVRFRVGGGSHVGPQPITAKTQEGRVRTLPTLNQQYTDVASIKSVKPLIRR